MNHQIEHDAHIGAALLERRQSMRLDEARLFNRLAAATIAGIETFEMSHLQHAAVALARVDQLAASATVVAIGFSISTWMPRSSAAQPIA